MSPGAFALWLPRSPTAAALAATHGLGNALGFALCSLLAWRRAATPSKETASWPV
ncbi:hypothetical protein ABZX98_14870 [Streptomyces sp. NPDC002992]|uniref:hypothetical protein n=1 Tax=Streptomyces sp. NPDC002992 TaxID=3154273 RepID=UPI0033B10241